jgi:hypothetical protein
MVLHPAPDSLSINELTRLNRQFLPRCQLFEFHECSWFPQSLKNAITEVLRVMCYELRVHEVILPLIEDVLTRTKTEQVVDLCSGAGGPIVPIQQRLAKSGRPVRVLLTDKFPNRPAFRRCEGLTGGLVRGYFDPVPAQNVPVELSGLRTLFNAFHHFPPDSAREILGNAYRSRQPIAIFEITERSVLNTLSNFPLSFLTMLAMLPRMQSRRPEWWLLTYLLPLLPLAFGWDASVSCMRSYTPGDFNTLIRGLEDDSYHWSGGRLPVPRSTIHVNYFLGVPAS